jgi:hypothetical protein
MAVRRIQFLLFVSAFVTFAWFHQGGGWNQNARFAEVRAIVEQGRLAVNDFLVYRPGPGWKMLREHVENGEFVREGKVHRLCWGDTPWDYKLVAANGRPVDDGTPLAVIGWDTCTGDIGYAPDGHFHPNKPPGLSLFAVPVYFVIHRIDRALGLDADDWWGMTVNAWLCSAFTVGLASAVGVVLVFRLALEMFPGSISAALGAALVAGFGTTFFPFGTLMFDHNLVAALLLAAFAAARSRRPFVAGLCAGVAAVCNYLAAVPGAMFGLWILLRDRHAPALGAVDAAAISPASRNPAMRWSDAGWFALGVLPCLAVLLAYNVAAFGSPFALNTSFQNPVFKENEPAFLGMFTWPSWFATIAITISPWRGLFVLSPVLIAAVVVLARRGEMQKLVWERRLILACAAFFFLVNVCFNGFHGGFAAGPRYLIPALPFLCLPLAAAFRRWPWATGILAAVAILQQTLLTVTDALNPLGVGSHAWVNRPGEWKDKLAGNSIVWRYAWPLFSQGRAWPVIHSKFEEWMEEQTERLAKEVADGSRRGEELARLRDETWRKIAQGEQEPLWIAAMPGPVSVNVMGPWDGTCFQQFPAHSEPAQWAAFNAGEWLWPGSRWSLLPLALLWIASGSAMACLARNAGASR